MLLGFWLGSLPHRAAVCGSSNASFLNHAWQPYMGSDDRMWGDQNHLTAVTKSRHQIKCLLNLSCSGAPLGAALDFTGTLAPNTRHVSFALHMPSHCPGPMSSDYPKHCSSYSRLLLWTRVDFIKYFITYLFVCARMRTCEHMRHSDHSLWTEVRGQYIETGSASPMWVPGTKLRLSDLATSTVSHWAIFLVGHWRVFKCTKLSALRETLTISLCKTKIFHLFLPLSPIMLSIRLVYTGIILC